LCQHSFLFVQMVIATSFDPFAGSSSGVCNTSLYYIKTNVDTIVYFVLLLSLKIVVLTDLDIPLILIFNLHSEGWNQGPLDTAAT
jgi:hypothetical protein